MKKALSSGVAALAVTAIVALASVPAAAQVEKLEGKTFDGAYGFGLKKPQPPEGPGTLFVYDVGGARVAETQTSHDAEITRPVPLSVATKDGKSRLYVGRHWVEVQ